MTSKLWRDGAPVPCSFTPENLREGLRLLLDPAEIERRRQDNERMRAIYEATMAERERRRTDGS